MTNRIELTDDEWLELYTLLLSNTNIYIISESSCRNFLNAVLWILRSGSQWRMLPTSFGHWNTVFKRFNRWSEKKIWESLHKGCSHHPDLQHIFIDSTITRAHACAAGAAHSDAETEALGRSKGGFSCKIHAITDALGNPLDFVLTPGQVSDITQAEPLLELTPEGAEFFVGDKGYDSDAFVAAILAKGLQVVIPPRSNRNEPRQCDWFVYKERHLIECFFNKIKHYRRVFSRFDKLARNYMSFIRFVSALIWLR